MFRFILVPILKMLGKKQDMQLSSLTDTVVEECTIFLSKKNEALLKDMWSRLWKEAEMSIDVAEWLTNQISVRVEIDMDYNSDENFKSSKLISATKGWANSLGYKVNVKPNNQIATKAADYHCK